MLSFLFLTVCFGGFTSTVTYNINAFVASHETCVVVDVTKQELVLYEGGVISKKYPISTSSKGTGQILDSGKTPLGIHYIKKKSGDMSPPGGILRGGKPTGEVWNPYVINVDDDLVLSRRISLEGAEKGFNKGTNDQGRVVDSFLRAILIHGTNHEDKIGTPASKGCVRMKNADIVDLYDRIHEGDSILLSR